MVLARDVELSLVATHLKGPWFFSLSLLSRFMTNRNTEYGYDKEHITFSFDSKDVSLSLHIGFSFVRAAVASSILERTSGLEPSSKTIVPT